MNRPLRRQLCSVLVVTTLAGVAVAQNNPTYEQLQSQYNDALNQLKKAQDRKNELDAENAKLQKRVEEAEKNAAEAQAGFDALRNRTYFLRAHFATFQDFLLQNPTVSTMWQAYFIDRPLSPTLIDLIGDGTWPFTLVD